MKILLALLLTASQVFAAVPAQNTALPLSGNLVFLAGGMSVDYLTGTFVKEVRADGTVILQDANGMEQTIVLATGGGMGAGLTVAQAQSLVGAMFTGNAETGGIELVYNSGTQKIDVTVALPDSMSALRGDLATVLSGAGFSTATGILTLQQFSGGSLSLNFTPRLLPSATGIPDGMVAKTSGGTWIIGTDNTGGGGTTVTYSTATPQGVSGTAGQVGTANNVSRGDHRHQLENNAVTTNKINDNAVSAEKIPDNIQLPSATGATNGRVAKVSGGGWALGDDVGEDNVQANWSESNTSSDAFIQNKPSVITSSERTKLSGIASNAEVNVQANWTESSSSNDAFIRNKPAIINPADVESFAKVGSPSATVPPARIADDIELPSASGQASGRVAKTDGSGNWVLGSDNVGQAGSGITDAGLATKVEDFAETDSTTATIPLRRMPGGASATDGQVAKVVSGALAMADDAQRTLSNAAPLAVTSSSFSVGTSDNVSREDHRHGLAAGTIDSNKIINGGVAQADLRSDIRPPSAASGTAGQVIVVNATEDGYDLGTASGGGASASTDLTDMPSTLTADRFLKTNSAASAYELVPEPTPAHAIPNVGKIPAVTDDSPDLVFLSHTVEFGTREDATFTIGFRNNEAGYDSDPPALGSINEDSPLTGLFGSGTTGNYSLQLLESFNEGWLASLDSVFIAGTGYPINPIFVAGGRFQRRIQGNPVGLSAATVTLNFRLNDDSYYWTDASDSTHYAGLYEKVDGEYRRLTSKGFVHIDGIGAPTEAPTVPAQSYIDDLGRLWISGDRREVIEGTPPTITGTTFWTDSYWEPTNMNGSFGLETVGFFQRRSGTVAYGQTWTQVRDYIVSIDNTAANIALRDDYVFLGIFSSPSQAAIERNRFDDATKTYLYVDDASLEQIYQITGFVSSPATVIDHFFWRGPHLVAGDAVDIVRDQVKVNLAGTTPTGDISELTIGDTTYRAVVRPNLATGVLRAPTVADYDTTHGKSRTLAFDGNVLYRAGRKLVGDHAAEGSWLNIAENADINGFRWRLVHGADRLIDSPQNRDFYWNHQCECFRIYDGTNWDESEASNIFINIRFIGNFDTEAHALAAATATGQYAIIDYRPGGGWWYLRQLTGFVAGAAGSYSYFWEKAETASHSQAAPGTEFSNDGVELLRDFARVERRDVDWVLTDGFADQSHGFALFGTDNFGTRPPAWPNNITAFYYETDAGQANENQRFILWHRAGSTNRTYDGAAFRVDGTAYELEYLERDTGDQHNGYRSTNTVPGFTERGGDTISVNLENAGGGDLPYDLPGTNWFNTLDPFVAGFVPGSGQSGDGSGSGGGTADASRLLPENATDGQYAAYNSATGVWDAVDAPTGGGGTGGMFPSPTTGTVTRADAYTSLLLVDTGFDISSGEWMLVRFNFVPGGSLTNMPYGVINLSELRALPAAVSTNLNGTTVYMNDYPHWNDGRVGHSASNTLVVALNATRVAGEGSITWGASIFQEGTGGGDSGGGSGTTIQAARLGLTSDLLHAADTEITIKWQEADFDDNSFWSAIDSTRINIPTGVARVILKAGISLNPATGQSELAMWIMKNGSDMVAVQSANHVGVHSSSPAGLALSTGIIPVVSGDYFQVQAFQSQAGSQNIDAVDATYFSIETR